MNIYIKNTETNEVLTLEAESYESLSKNFRKAPYERVSEAEESAKELDLVKSEKTTQCKNYLTSTDWYIIRVADSGDVVPHDISENRARARDNIDLIEKCNDLGKLNKINTDF